MSYDSGNFHASLVAAVGDDAGLIEDLRVAFMESAERDIDLLSRARCDANWKIAAWRLQGLCASFGVTSMIALAQEAEVSAPGDPAIVRRLRTALSLLSQQ
jgi:HPt (histidine-containing phosphotransfer) domain-containing protein